MAQGGGLVDSKQVFVWTHELHLRFMVAVQKLGFNTAAPLAILQVCGGEGIGVQREEAAAGPRTPACF